MEKQEKKTEEKENKEEKVSQSSKTEKCTDKDCPTHGSLKVRGRHFKGKVVKKLPRRIAIEFERVLRVKKYERYMKRKTKIHARLPDCLKDEIEVLNSLGS